jgi:hypothetical protein
MPDGQALESLECWVYPGRALGASNRDNPLIDIPMKTLNRMLHGAAVASCALAATLACSAPPAADEHVGANAERGDPARWYVPADTPQLKYDTQVKEANAVLGEALKECRALQAGRTDCVAQAKAQHHRDLEAARSVLATRQGR